VAEDWRLTVRLHGDHGGRLLQALHGHEVEVEDEVRSRYGDRIAVGGDGSRVFLYADTEAAAREAEQVVKDLLAAQHVSGQFKLDCWHHLEERWEDASVPLPTTATAKQAEHARLEAEETAEARATGVAAWEVRIELASHHDAHALAEQLEGEGFTQIVRRWQYLLIGTANEDDAHTLAQRLQGELPAGARIEVEPGGGLAWQLSPRNPFAVFGGFAS